MIEIKSLSKFYDDYKALYMIDLALPRYGMIAIQGPSGCGKTTLLNCLAGLIPYEGSITIDGYEYKKKTDSQNSYYRLSNIGFIFQDFRLFENETVLENIMFPLDTLNNSNKGKKLIKCDELLKLVDLKGKANQYVSSLSGGEKQRVCIARSLINNPKIILADEPTGALDETNSKQIMDILRKISSKSLVLVVTHDDSLAKDYADQIIQMEDGKIRNIIYQSKDNKKAYIPVVNTRSQNKKPSVSLSFVFKHSFHALKKKKIRSFICSITTSIGLIGVGLALSISSFISKNVKDAYSALIKKDQIIISTKNPEKTKYGEYKASYSDTQKIAMKNKEYVIDVGVNYVVDFESVFCDCNELDIADTAYKTPIRGITARHINEFEWLDASNGEFYPYKPSFLEDDEIFLGLPITSVNDICYLLRIERSISSLSNYLAINNCYLVFNFAHNEWGYEDQQIVNLKGFTLENDLKIYHTNHLWNQYMFEERMRFPTDEGVDEEDYFPWTFKKYYYLYCKENIDTFLTYINKSQEYNNFVLEIADKKYFPMLYKSTDVKDKRRVIVFKNKLDCIESGLVDILLEYEDNICDPIIGCLDGYVIYPYNLMMGFSQNAFLSFDIDKINDAIDVETNYMLNEDESVEYPEGILQGHFTKSMLKGLSFSPLPEKLAYGRAPETLDEIVISKGIANLIDEDYLFNGIYFSFPSNTIQTSTGELLKTYKTVTLKVVGLVDSDEYIIYHDYMWPISFFQSRIGISMFNLKCQNISFSLKNSKDLNTSLEKLRKGFPDYDIINPLKDIDNSVDELSNYVSVISFMFSLLASITSILLISLCSYLHVFETRHEIGLARCIGVNKKQASKFVYSHALTLAGISLALSCIELFTLTCFISYEMNGKLLLIVSPIPYLAMFGLALGISLLASFFIHLSIKRHNPIEATKY